MENTGISNRSSIVCNEIIEEFTRNKSGIKYESLYEERRDSERIVMSFFFNVSVILYFFTSSKYRFTYRNVYFAASISFRPGVARNYIHHAPRDGQSDKSRYSESEREVAADAGSARDERKGAPVIYDKFRSARKDRSFLSRKVQC